MVTPTVTFYRDHLLTYLPLAQYQHHRLAAGELPRWYPLEALGVPLVGQLAVGTFHPLTYLFLPLSPEMAVKWTLLTGYLLASVGAYRFARALPVDRPSAVGAAIFFAYGGFMLGISSTVPYVLSHAALPWVCWSLVRLTRRRRPRDVLALAVSLALVVLAGDPQTALLCGLLAVAAVAATGAWRSLPAMGGGAAIAALLCLVELLPARLCFGQSVRVLGEVSSTIARTWALHPLRLPELLVPGFVPDSVRLTVAPLLGQEKLRSFFVTTIFLGGIGSAAAVLGLRSGGRLVRVFAGVALVTLVMALGGWGHLLPVLQAIAPPLARFRYPEKYLGVTWLALVPAVATGLSRLRRSGPVRPLLVFGCCLAILTALVALAPVARWWFPWAQEPSAEVLDALRAAWVSGLLWRVVFVSLAAAVVVAARRRPGFVALLPVLLWAELWQANAAHLPVVPRGVLASGPFASLFEAPADAPRPLPRVLSEAPALPEFIHASDEDHAWWVTSTLATLISDAGALQGANEISPRLGAFSLRYFRLLYGDPGRTSRWAPLLNVCFNVGPGAAPECTRDDRTGFQVCTRSCSPRAYLTGTRSFPSAAAVDEYLGRNGPAADSVPWERGPELPRGSGTVRWLANRPEHVTLEVSADRTTGLVLADELAPGWNARVDGEAVRIFPALLALRGIVVGPGTHRVDFEYVTPGLKLGAGVSLGTLVLALLLLGWDLRRLRRTRGRIEPPLEPA
jgi:hypothetical protein